MKTGFLSRARTEAGIALTIIRTNIAAGMELRAAFALQIVGMMLNNTAFVVVWVYFFQAFGTINGWSATETIGMQGFSAFMFGIAFTFAGGSSYLPNLVDNGSFDSVLLSPRNLYIRILTSKVTISALGDIAFGVVLMGMYLFLAHVSFLQACIFLSILPAAALVMINVTFITALSAFVFPDASGFARNAFDVFFTPSMYPAALFQGALRFIFTFAIPSLVIAGIPIETIRDVRWQGVVLIWIMAFVWTFLAVKLLKIGLKKYESGNLTGARI